ncbi:MAG: 5-formyltetrahydrofolate cyclo-ligase [Clostridia bacterium]|nr:5-formyltetrahydrofolate cyclo-ligase [Clostridia bacterium]
MMNETELIDITGQKAALRRSIRASRRALSEEERRESALAVAEKLLSVKEISGASCVLAYMPMRYELDVAPAVEALKRLGASVAYPLCTEGSGLRLFIPDEEGGFTLGAYGILEPVPERSREIAPEELDAIILPAIGFDPMCRRLGQGGGYYDRLLARVSCFTAAVGFDCQLVPEVPCEPTDKTVDIVVTPQCIIRA